MTKLDNLDNLDKALLLVLLSTVIAISYFSVKMYY